MIGEAIPDEVFLGIHRGHRTQPTARPYEAPLTKRAHSTSATT